METARVTLPVWRLMDVDNSLGNQRHSWVSTKSKAPSPPGLKALDSPGFSQWYPGNPHSAMDQKENLIDKDLSLVVVLPGGIEKMTTVHGSKPLMDLLVTLCAKYHLNPSGHTLELVTANRNNVKLKPNALIGTIEAEKIILKPKGEDKNKKTSSQMPEATVRMVINYKRTQKTILRVNPRVPLAELLPAICEKCEFDAETTVLLRDVQSLAPLDLSSSLNDYAIREVYAKDTKGQPAPPVCPASPTHAGTVPPGKDKNQKEKENKGLFSKFRKSKKSSDQVATASAPASPALVSKPRPHSMALPSTDLSPLTSPTIPGDVPKKRRAPQPPGPASNSCPSDPSTRRRINSEPAYHLDSDQMQMAGISRGSSAESSLKRTKRKAPPPPTSPTVVPDTVPVAENVQAEGASAKTLEEIMEQEETPPSVMSATTGDTQGEDSSFSMSADVSLHSPSPDTEMLSAESVEGNEDDLSRDLSSDGNRPQSTVNGSVTLSDVRTAANTGSSDPTDACDGPCHVENVTRQPESTCVGVVSECSAVASSAAQPATQETQSQASVQASTEIPQEHMDKLESPVPVSTPCPSGEDALVQTDFTLLPPPPPQQHMDEVPSAANATSPESPGKKDTATLTDVLPPPDPEEHAASHISGTSPRPASTASVSAAAKAPNVYAADSEPKPKPKPSNELTRDYIPKVGMTTYTIVPQKSLEKLRYFEVALTLETPPAPPEDGLPIGSLHLRESVAPGEPHPAAVPREDPPTSTATTRNTVCRSPPGSTHSSSLPSPAENDGKLSFASVASQTGPPAEVKETKIPPATKPKPGSFRLPQHKKTPGYYVTSAAEKSMSAGPASPGSVQREAPGSPGRSPLSPPVQFPEETAGATNVQPCPQGADKNPAFVRMTRQSSLPCKEPSAGLSLEKLRSLTAPRPYAPVTPSRFAQAVSSAVKRSQSLSYRPKSPRSPPFSPAASRPPGTASKGLFNLKGSENRGVDGDKGSILQSAEAESPSFTAVVKMEGETGP